MTRKEHILTIVAEECAEVHQRCSKALRFGMDEVQEGQLLDNRQRILYEFNDLIAAMEMLFGCSIAELIDSKKIIDKKQKIEKYLRYATDCDTLQ